jgi:hypothetical protein
MHADAVAKARALAGNQDGVISMRQAMAAGLSFDDVEVLRRRSEWRRVTRGVYIVDAELYDETPRRAVLRAALIRHGDEAALWGATAAEALGIGGIVGWSSKPWVLVPFDQAKHPDPDARLRFRVLNESEIVVVDGFRVTFPQRTLADAVPLFDRATGLSLLDSALHVERIDPSDLATVCELAKGRRGAPKVRELAQYADGRAASPLESRVRLPCIDGNIPPDELQWPVLDVNGVLLGYADMAWIRNRRRPLVAEADGEEEHGKPKALYRDRRRGNDFTGAAVDTVRFTWLDSKSPAYIQSSVRRALAADAA